MTTPKIPEPGREERELLAERLEYDADVLEEIIQPRIVRLRRAAAIVRASVHPAWQPIATAPRDRWILGALAGGSLVIVQWSEAYEDWENQDFDGVSPTHWLPLPTPPHTEETE